MGRYETGVDPYIDVVTLQNTVLSNQQTVYSLQIEQMTGAVQLVEALGGGWDTSQLPTPNAGLADPAQGGYADSAVERLQRFDLFCGCSQPQADALMRWRRTKLIRECLAAGAFEEDKVEQTACSFFREQPFQFQPIGMVCEHRPGLE